ncbi:hypothetical protein FPQ18DRAFT_345084 [Pyronema domesticum]|uniref:Similar to Protein fmp52-1, mitochondrial acc. no. Q2UMY4 n=1 Tax=Pyronema omphalodes (strain CBS 100304) TaxID=1076935 RepID=U4LTP5_PYROM|nr:hypothetical protein FPQ18DRAFT_345084 [Pyronema domesticum]CCX30966.1 Similar to Protein fmp52-1, mitochondrial; acc. no. Q2UMY4 [Pyronema omphalodes CBS 100304]
MTYNATVIGSTGLVGSQILTRLLTTPSVTSVSTLIRRPSPHAIPQSTAHHETISSDTATWAATLPAILAAKNSSILFSGLGTTRGDAGSIEAQKKIDYDLNLALAKSAKKSGVKTYVLISSANAKANSWLPYVAMKGQLEDDVAALGFEKCVIVRPGLIVGSREKTRAMEQPLHYVANFMGAIAGPLKNVWAQDASAIAKAAIRAATEEGVWEGRKTVEGKNGGKVWFMGQGEIVELGSN